MLNEVVKFVADNYASVTSTINTMSEIIFGALFLRRNTSIEEFEKLKAGKFNEVANQLLDKGHISYKEFYYMNNYLDIAERADQYSNHIVINDYSNYNFDWFIKFYEYAGCISDEDMKDIWAKLLASEVDNPKSNSLKTLDVLKNMTKEDALVFKKIFSFSVHTSTKDYYLPNYEKYLKYADIKFVEIMRMDELGIIHGSGLINEHINIKTTNDILCVNDNLLLLSHPNNSQTVLKIPTYPFTFSGNELSKLLIDKISDNSFIEFCKEVKTDNPQLKLSLHKIIQADGNTYEFDDSKDILV